jgi:glycerophosphoryl diester phosphodiesterase
VPSRGEKQRKEPGISAFEVVAHRGVPTERHENTLPSFQRAIELGADAVELDVRLTRDQVPLVYHYFYLEEAAGLPGPVFRYSWPEIRRAQQDAGADTLATLPEVLDAIGGRIGLEIEVKGPEPESAATVSGILRQYRTLWDSIEVTSYEPALLLAMAALCPGLPTDLLLPRSESWMRLDVVTHLAIHRARLAGARAVHLHPTQLAADVVAAVRDAEIEVHAWDVDDEASLALCAGLAIPRICTNRLGQALAFRSRHAANGT